MPSRAKNNSSRAAAWIASFAILWAALAPSISHALAAYTGGPAGTVLVCTSMGYKWVSVATGKERDASGETEKSSSHFERCAFCGTHGGSVALLPAGAFTAPVIDATHLTPSLFRHAPRPLFAWSASRSRAPPISLR